MDMRELALRQAALKTLADAVAAERSTVQAEMQTALEATGAERVGAALPDGTRVGTVIVIRPKAAATVVDDTAFVEWVRAAAPTEVTTRVVTEVRPGYRAALLEQMTAAGAAEVPDQTTGEITAVPGVEIKAGRAATHSVRLAEDGAERLITAWRDGDLAHLVLPQLGASDTSGVSA